jgi:hypothetical protein
MSKIPCKHEGCRGFVYIDPPVPAASNVSPELQKSHMIYVSERASKIKPDERSIAVVKSKDRIQFFLKAELEKVVLKALVEVIRLMPFTGALPEFEGLSEVLQSRKEMTAHRFFLTCDSTDNGGPHEHEYNVSI